MRKHLPERFAMPRWARWWIYAGGATALLTGAGWLLLHHFVRVEGAFGPEAHPLEHPALVLHGVAAAALLWAFGLIWLGHVRRAWHRRFNRRSGGTMVGLMVWLGASGLGLYYLADEQWREVASIGHWTLGLFAGAWLPIHVWRGRRAVRAQAHSRG